MHDAQLTTVLTLSRVQGTAIPSWERNLAFATNRCTE